MAARKHHTKHGGFGWSPDLPDPRDYVYAAPFEVLKALPKHVDLRPNCPSVYDQGQLGSCVANATAGAVQFDWMRQKTHGNVVPSRLFVYYACRLIEHTTGYDSGAMIRDGIKSVANYGAPPETEWPYDIAKFTVRPPAQVWTDALKDQAVQYSRVTRTLSQFKGCLASGFPFMFGFSVFSSFESDEVANTGVVPMPDTQNEDLLGGHAVLAVGYDDASRRFIVRNSWGSGWGMSGYFTMPYAYLTDSSLSSDFWVVKSMEA